MRQFIVKKPHILIKTKNVGWDGCSTQGSPSATQWEDKIACWGFCLLWRCSGHISVAWLSVACYWMYTSGPCRWCIFQCSPSGDWTCLYWQVQDWSSFCGGNCWGWNCPWTALHQRKSAWRGWEGQVGSKLWQWRRLGEVLVDPGLGHIANQVPIMLLMQINIVSFSVFLSIDTQKCLFLNSHVCSYSLKCVCCRVDLSVCLSCNETCRHVLTHSWSKPVKFKRDVAVIAGERDFQVFYLHEQAIHFSQFPLTG